MELVFVTILLALVEYMVMAAMVGRARAQSGVKAPAMSGHPDFERINRVHQNTLESLIVFVPAVWIFGLYLSALWAAVLGALFLVARVIYAIGYRRAAEKRAPGAGITGIVNLILIAGGLFGLDRSWQ
jgi:uncharacterized MAPEG superfamily protein